MACLKYQYPVSSVSLIYSTHSKRGIVECEEYIMASIRHLCMNLFECKPSKISLAKKQLKAGCSNE